MDSHCCDCGHNHKDCHSCGHLKQLYIAVIIFIIALVSPISIKPFIYIIAYLIAGFFVLKSSFKNILKGKIFDENFLMSIATIGAICIKEYPEAVMVMILYLLGEHFQDKAVDKARDSITDLIDIKSEYANIEENGEIKQITPEIVSIGSIIIVKPGEKIPIDGIIIQGNSQIDISSLTGESMPVNAKVNDIVLSGSINISGLLKIKTTKIYAESTAAKILKLVENSEKNKSKTENYITKFAQIYTPIVVLCAIMIVVIPLIIQGSMFISEWINRALTFLVISCPCAFVISVPLTFYAGIGCASKHGILIKGSNYIEQLSKTDIAVFDKTGTLTDGLLSVSDIISVNYSEEEILKYAAYVESCSNHPIAKTIVNYYGKYIDNSVIKELIEYSGKGIKAIVEQKEILIGNEILMSENGITVDYIGNVKEIYIAIDNIYAGKIILSDSIKNNILFAIRDLKKYVNRIIILTGDSEENTNYVASKVNISEFYSKLLPSEKVSKIEEFIAEKKQNKSVIYAGDGINDSPVIMRADVGIAMGALGSDAAIEAADVVISDDNIEKIPLAIRISKHTMKIVKQNIALAISVKLIFLIFGAFGYMTIWLAVFDDVGVTLIAVLNALRTLRIKK